VEPSIQLWFVRLYEWDLSKEECREERNGYLDSGRSPGKTCKLLGKERLKTVSQEVSDD
jgi:hypothetical protein